MVVVGLERELTVEAARQAALSAGARVVGVADGGLARPDGRSVSCSANRRTSSFWSAGPTGATRRCSARPRTTLARVGEGQVPVVVAGNRRGPGRGRCDAAHRRLARETRSQRHAGDR